AERAVERAHHHALALQLGMRLLQHHVAVALNDQRVGRSLALEAGENSRRQIVEVAGTRAGNERIEVADRALERAKVRAPPQLVEPAGEGQRQGSPGRGATALERPLGLATALRTLLRAHRALAEQAASRQVRRHPTEPSIWS